MAKTDRGQVAFLRAAIEHNESVLLVTPEHDVVFCPGKPPAFRPPRIRGRRADVMVFDECIHIEEPRRGED